MPNQMFDRLRMNQRERPVSRDFNTMQSEADRTFREVLERILAGRTDIGNDAMTVLSGFFGDSFKVVPTSPTSMSVSVNYGIGLQDEPGDVPLGINNIVGLDDLCSYKPLVLADPVTFACAVPALTGGVTQYRTDIIEVAYNRRVKDSTLRRILTIPNLMLSPAYLKKTLSYALFTTAGPVAADADSEADISYKIGVPTTLTPSAPPTTSGYTKVAEVTLNSGMTAIDYNAIVGTRGLLVANGQFRAFMRISGIDSSFTLTAPPGVVGGYNNLPPGGIFNFIGGSSVHEGWAYIFADSVSAVSANLYVGNRESAVPRDSTYSLSVGKAITGGPPTPVHEQPFAGTIANGTPYAKMYFAYDPPVIAGTYMDFSIDWRITP